jgi:hypothetical protein
MDTDKIMAQLLAPAVQRAATYHPPIGSCQTCSNAAGERICLIVDRIGHNSEKQFNNPPFLDGACIKGEW